MFRSKKYIYQFFIWKTKNKNSNIKNENKNGISGINKVDKVNTSKNYIDEKMILLILQVF